MNTYTVALKDADEIEEFLLGATGMKPDYLQLSKGLGGLQYRVVEFAGPGLDPLNWDARQALCTSPTEVRAVGVFIPPSNAMLKQIEAIADRDFQPVESDPDAEFEADLTFDLDDLATIVVNVG